MDTGTLQIVFCHLTGSRATHVDVVPPGERRELIHGCARSAAVRFAPRLEFLLEYVPLPAATA